MRRERKRAKLVINITSMIDVIFLLLIFFLVTSTFSDQPGLKIELPQARGVETAAAKQLVLYITRKGDIYFNQHRISRAELPERLRRAAEKDRPALLLKADRRVSYGLIVELMDITHRAGIKKIVALTAPGNKSPIPDKLSPKRHEESEVDK
jgi:biopolymer transport protein ExbD